MGKMYPSITATGALMNRWKKVIRSHFIVTIWNSEVLWRTSVKGFVRPSVRLSIPLQGRPLRIFINTMAEGPSCTCRGVMLSSCSYSSILPFNCCLNDSLLEIKTTLKCSMKKGLSCYVMLCHVMYQIRIKTQDVHWIKDLWKSWNAESQFFEV